MPVLQLDDQQFPLKAGTTRIGAGADADVVVPGYSALGIEALIDGGATPTVRRAEEAAHVRVNGVLLGAEPTPLMHGDKLEIAGLELRFSDDAKGGATQFVSASEIAAIAGSKRAAGRATTKSGGRLVSLVDGKEYAVPDGGIVFGRDAGSDVVVAQSEVSRRHAEIVPDGEGYILRDLSANGVFVNGDRVQGSHRLARADVLRIGTEEFRFYADIAPAAPTPPRPAPVIPAPAPVPPAPPVMESDLPDIELLPMPTPAPVPAMAPSAPTPPASAAPVAPPAAAKAPVTPVNSPAAKDPRAVLAILESMNEGPGKGTKYELRSPLGHVGRGAHNDVRLSDESVSETHAKIQRREDGWYVVDMDSTNGTYVGGSRVVGEKRIEGSPDVRFGGMKFRFSSVGVGSAAEMEAKGTRAITAMGRASAMDSHSIAKTPTPVEPMVTQKKDEPAAKGGTPAWVWVVVAVVIAAVAFFVLKGRA